MTWMTPVVLIMSFLTTSAPLTFQSKEEIEQQG